MTRKTFLLGEDEFPYSLSGSGEEDFLRTSLDREFLPLLSLDELLLFLPMHIVFDFLEFGSTNDRTGLRLLPPF